MWQIDITRQLPEDKFEFPGDAIDQGRINGKRLVIDKSVWIGFDCTFFYSKFRTLLKKKNFEGSSIVSFKKVALDWNIRNIADGRDS